MSNTCIILITVYVVVLIILLVFFRKRIRNDFGETWDEDASESYRRQYGHRKDTEVGYFTYSTIILWPLAAGIFIFGLLIVIFDSVFETFK